MRISFVAIVFAATHFLACDAGKTLLRPDPEQPVCLAEASEDPAAWTSLFNGTDLGGWYSWNPTYARDDVQGIFQVHDGMIHVLGIPEHDGEQDFAFLSTVEEFENVRIRFDYKWGTKIFNPFKEHGWPKDSGFFYGVTGPDQIWPTAHEYNVFAGTVGGSVSLGLSGLTTIAESRAGEPLPFFAVGGERYDTPRTTDFTKTGVRADTAALEHPNDWNSAEIIFLGNASRHLLNGHTVLSATNLRQRTSDASDPSTDRPLTRGRFAIQEESAEIFYRNIRVQHLDPECSRL